MKKNAFYFAVSTLAMIGASGLARAQDNGATAQTENAGLGEIIVTAQRQAERAQDVPISLTVLSADTLTAVGVTDTLGLERVTPGLSMQQQNGYVNPSLRGITTSVVTAGAENPIAMYLDGVYISNMGGSTFSLPDVERIEVLKGPQGTLFGRNATGGAVQIFTKKPSMTPTGQVAVTTGYYTGAGSSRSAYDLQVKGFVSGPIVQDIMAASVAFSTRRSNGFGTNVAYARVSPAEQRAFGSDRVAKTDDYMIRSKLLFTPTENFSMLLTGSYSHAKGDRNQGGYIGLNGTALTLGELAFPTRYTATKPWQYAYDSLKPGTIVDMRGASLKMDLELEAGTISSMSAYAWSKYQEFNDSDASYIPGCLNAFACTAVFDSIRDKSFQQELLFSSKKFGRLSFVSGVNYYHGNAVVDVQVNDFETGSKPLGNVVNPSLFFYNQTVKTKSVGVFTELNYELTDDLTVIAGLRYSDEKKTGVLNTYGGLDFTAGSPTFFQDILFLPPNFPLNTASSKRWTPRVSFRYALDDRSNVYFTFSQGFKSGVIPGGAPGAPKVAPEKITAYEVGYKTAQSNYTLNLAAFYYDYKDLQVQSNGGAGGVVNIVANAAKAKIWGFDLDGSLQLTDEFSIRGGVSWIPYAKYKEYLGAPVFLPRPVDPANPTAFPVSGPGIFSPGTNVDLSGTRLFKTPKVTASFSATYEVDTGGGSVSFTPNVYYASKLYTDPTHLDVLSTDNFKLGAEIAYKPEGGSWRLALWGKNLTNNHAFVSLSNNPSGLTLIPPDPMELGATMTFDF